MFSIAQNKHCVAPANAAANGNNNNTYCKSAYIISFNSQILGIDTVLNLRCIDKEN